jgi:hypothetical protein
MRSLSAGVFAIATILCATPLSLRWSPGSDTPASLSFDSAVAAELNVPVRHHRRAGRGYYAHYARSWDYYCDGPYVGGGWNGGTYFGGPWMDLRCYGHVY